MAQDDPSSLQADPSPVGRAERLRQSADEAARLARTLLITFLVIGLYIAITIASTTDVQLLKIAPVQLPLLDIGLPIVGFYAMVPWLLVLVHLNLLLQFYLLGRKLHAFNEVVRPLESADRREQRERLFPSPLSHMLAGHQHSPLVKALLAAMVWTTVVILQLALLIWAEVRFLPYRDTTVTWCGWDRLGRALAVMVPDRHRGPSEQVVGRLLPEPPVSPALGSLGLPQSRHAVRTPARGCAVAP